MGKYAKKQIVVDAMQWTGDNYPEICKWAGEKFGLGDKDGLPRLLIFTREGRKDAIPKDYIIREPFAIEGGRRFYIETENLFCLGYEEIKAIREKESEDA